jgi:F0F1-type ATP synthase assembly protein I
MMALPIAAGVLLGRLADDALGTNPYGTLLLIAAGIGVALIEAYRAASQALKVIRRG